MIESMVNLMSNIRENQNSDTTIRLIYYELPVLLQKIICSAHQSVGCDGLEMNLEYVKEYANEARKVANLSLDSQLATLEAIIKSD